MATCICSIIYKDQFLNQVHAGQLCMADLLKLLLSAKSVYMCACICLFAYMPACLSVCLPAYLPVSLSGYLPVSLSASMILLTIDMIWHDTNPT